MSSLENEVIVPGDGAFGFCGGVSAADDYLGMVTGLAKEEGIKTVYGYHGIVHNDAVIKRHTDSGVVFVDSVEDIPPEEIVVGSAHGSSPTVKHAISEMGGLFLDGVCPLVLRTHRAVQRARNDGENRLVIYLVKNKPEPGEHIHDEVLGTIGHMDYTISHEGKLIHNPISRRYVELGDEPEKVAKSLVDENGNLRISIIGQTTLLKTAVVEYRDGLSDEIRKKHPDTDIAKVSVDFVCAAVEKRQEGVRALLEKEPDHMVVVTDPKSSNGKGYAQLAASIVEAEGLDAEVHTVSDSSELKRGGMGGRIAVTASASTPDSVTAVVVGGLGGDEEIVTGVERKSFYHGRDEKVKKKIKEWKEERDAA